MSDKKIETGQRMLNMRKQMKKSQSDAADFLGLSVAAYQNYETGRREANYETLCKLADFYGVTTDYLLGREPEKNPIAMLNLAIGEKEALEMYIKLPEEVRQIIIDTMIQLGEAAKNAKCLNNEVSDENVVILKSNDIKPNTYLVKTAARRGVDGKHSPITTEYLTAEEISDIINAEDADDDL